MEIKTLSHVVFLVLILIEAGKASKREFNTRGDLTERVDAVEKSLDRLKEDFNSLSFLVADLMNGVKNKSDTVAANDFDESSYSDESGDSDQFSEFDFDIGGPESIALHRPQVPYTVLRKFDQVGF